MTTSKTMKQKYFDEGHIHPICVNEGCDCKVTVREWKYWSFKSECSRCIKARKENKIIEGVTIHKKRYCENHDGHLGFKCPVDGSQWELFQSSLDLDHLDGDHGNNQPENVRTYCKLCHSRKSLDNGDCSNVKTSSRRIE